jgi:hypothetical protein
VLSMIGILAYGSLIADPGWEIKELTRQTIVDVETPFAVEYARASDTRAGAPTLVPIPDGKGTKVISHLFILKPRTRITSAKNILFRREIHQIGNRDKSYVHSNNPSVNKTIVDEIRRFNKINLVLYTRIGVNLPEIIDDNVTDHDKAERLATLAINSINESTFFTCQDGIHYFNTAMHYGVRTRLTELYKQSILRLTDNSPSLEEARLWVARRNRINS